MARASLLNLKKLLAALAGLVLWIAAIIVVATGCWRGGPPGRNVP